MAAVTLFISRGIMETDATSIVRHNLKVRSIMASLTLGFGAIGKCTVNGMAEHTSLGPRAVCSSNICVAAKAGTVPDIGNPINVVYGVTFAACGRACYMAIYTIPSVGHNTRYTAHILQRRGFCMTPNTCLIVAINGETVLRMTGITVYCRP